MVSEYDLRVIVPILTDLFNIVKGALMKCAVTLEKYLFSPLYPRNPLTGTLANSEDKYEMQHFI